MANLEKLLINQLQHLLDAETQLTTALPRLASAAHNPMLKEAFQQHLHETQRHVEHVQQALKLLGAKADQQECVGMKGLVAEGEEVIAEGRKMPAELADLALGAAAQRVEHFEIASYGTVRTIARLIGQTQVARLLETILSDEEAADYLLTAVSKPLLQQSATEYYAPHAKRHEAIASR